MIGLIVMWRSPWEDRRAVSSSHVLFSLFTPPLESSAYKTFLYSDFLNCGRVPIALNHNGNKTHLCYNRLGTGFSSRFSNDNTWLCVVIVQVGSQKLSSVCAWKQLRHWQETRRWCLISGKWGKDWDKSADKKDGNVLMLYTAVSTTPSLTMESHDIVLLHCEWHFLVSSLSNIRL